MPAEEAAQAVAAGLEHHRAGRLAEAAGAYRRAVELDPRHAEALHLLGVVHYQAKDFAGAARLIGEALRHARRPEFLSNLAIALMELGRHTDAERALRDALALRPDYPEALSNLGNALRAQGRPADAVSAYRAALAARPDYPEAGNNLGTALADLGRTDEAVAALRSVTARHPGFAEAAYNLGNACRAAGRPDEALATYDKALAIRPNHAETHNNRGLALQALGRPGDAAASFRRAIALRPDAAALHGNLADALLEAGDVGAAVEAFRAALAIRPDWAEQHYNLANALRRAGRRIEAVAAYRAALALRPAFAEALNNLGTVLQELGRPMEAEAALRTALALRPDYADACNNLGAALRRLGRLDEAIAAFRTAVARRPGYADALKNLGTTLHDAGEPAEAVAALRAAAALVPDSAEALAEFVHLRQHGCDWDGLDGETGRLLDLLRGEAEPVSPFIVLALPSTRADQLRVARRWAGALKVEPGAAFAHGAAAPRERLRIGYLSADLHSHATAFLMAELFERHDRSRVETVAYSYGPDDGTPMRRRLVAAFDRFVEIGPLPHLEAARRIRDDDIDILVDLKGYTKDTRSEILAYRPAPIQASYLGYPGTMGADFVDYLLADPIVAPPGHHADYAERIVLLPGCYQANDAQREIAQTPARQECGLPADGFVFASLNNTYKITPAFFDAWMRLLEAVPGSVLWLLETSGWATANLRRAAEARGVDAGRLVFAPRLPLPDHLARQRLADLFLDTLPVNAHTTASDALWAGLPVLTCTGDTFAGRVAGSLLHAVGLPELVTASLAEYEALALALAREPPRLAGLRSRLAGATGSSALFDARRLAGRIEAAYARMHAIRLAGEPPRGFAVPEEGA